MSLVRVAAAAALLGIALAAGATDSSAGQAAGPRLDSFSSSPVTVYAATWCSACRSLEQGLTERQVPFDVVDVEKNPNAFERARAQAGAGSSIPLTGVVRASDTVWIVGADVDAVDRAYRSR